LKARHGNSAAVTVRSAAFPHAALTRPAVTSLPFVVRARGLPMDVIFILALGLLYVVTHWLIAALARLGSPE
jgi:hypothetical protein